MSLTRFEQFMTGFLDNRVPTNLERVHCVCDYQCWDETHALMGWLDRVVLLMPLQIRIFTRGTGNSLDMPGLVFSCASLQHLLLSINPDFSPMKTIISPISINLPSLKLLELIRVELPNDFARKLSMGCSSLERLILRGCELNFSDISSEVLKELSLYDCCLYEQMQISCPALVSLFMRVYLLKNGFSLKNMTSLVNAVIKLSRNRWYYFNDDDVPVLNLFGGLSNVTNLELCLHFPKLKEQLEKDIPNCRNFNNLKKLVVGGWDMIDDFYLIACLLKCSPNLKELILVFSESQSERQEPPQEVSGDVLFQHEYLETVKISHVYGGICGQSKLSSELINAMIKMLGSYVKKIGNVIIT
ncbi:F-box/FBD/LRR-repeat protein [Carex littledalei]|uniref:F-box/FBD/LRR-repeat protein n=1 Tax=Carex littledalei TaxID=544730 RepID=A0A833RGT9_9POAL|nr:F-box/FBD/LRR-repeat protein [Carex littledalei]